MKDIARLGEDIGIQVSQLGPFALTVLACLIAGFLVKTVSFVPNKLIPLVTFLVASAVYLSLGNPADAPYEMRHPWVRHLAIGGAAWVTAWVIYAKFLKGLNMDKLFNGKDSEEEK